MHSSLGVTAGLFLIPGGGYKNQREPRRSVGGNGGDPRTLEDPQRIQIEASGCGGGIWWGKDEQLGCWLGTKFRASKEQNILRVGPRSYSLSSKPSVTSPRENEETSVARMGREKVSLT